MIPDTCKCEDGEEISPSELFSDATSDPSEGLLTKFRNVRRKLKKTFKKCKPVSCNCPNGQEKILTIFGCSQGGIPGCAGETNRERKLQCVDGSKFNGLKAFLAQNQGKCVCEDGKAPLCQNGDKPTCPNGELPNESLAKVPDLLSQCEQ